MCYLLHGHSRELHFDPFYFRKFDVSYKIKREGKRKCIPWLSARLALRCVSGAFWGGDVALDPEATEEWDESIHTLSNPFFLN